MAWSNWSGSVVCEPNQLLYPNSEEEIVQIVQSARQSGQTIRIVGAGHSFVPLVKTNQILVSLTNLQGIVKVDRIRNEIAVKAGTQIKALNQLLYEEGYAPENLGDIDVQSIAGAISTGTHGTGATLQSVSNQVVALRFVTGTGEIISCSTQDRPELFKALQVSLGALGIITEVTLRCLPSYKLHLRWFKTTLTECLNNYEQYCQENRHFEFFWIPHTDTVMVKLMNISDEEPKSSNWMRRFNETVVENAVLGFIMNINTWLPKQSKIVAQLMASLVTGGEDIQYAHQVFATERKVLFQEMEYNVPRENFVEALRNIETQITSKNFPILFPIECRFVHSDDIYLSPAYQREAAYIAVHEYYKKPHRNYFDMVEPIFDEFQGRPHWGKMHTKTATELKILYPKWDTFQQLRQQLDPDGLFINDYLKQIFGI